MFTWRKKAKAIHTGNTTHFLPVENTYGYFRYTDHEAVFVFLNPTRKEHLIDWHYFAECLEGYTYGINILTDERIEVGLPYKVPAHTSMVIELYK
ncbi:MAG: cyclomaltodextrinase C-terminal domain-containing protein [Bacteroides sp.]|nr:cyclomaltodextrinase C-terminal domain-containing protein [Bacteroides sp.]